MKYFSEKELRINEAPESIKDNMKNLVLHVLDPLREKIGKIKVTSGYRTKEYNKSVGGAWNSQHCLGMACDIVPMDFNTMKAFNIIVNTLDYDQVIYEKSDNGSIWIHVSYNKGKNRKQALIADKVNGKWIYKPF